MDTAAQKPSEKPSSSNNTDGDHDSGVDETTQRKDGPTTNGDLGSPSKSPSKIPAPKRLSMPSPTKSTKASPKTPEAPPTADKKKVPMNKIQVGAAPSPNLKTVKSKIGSLQNTTHKPGGGNIKIENRKLDWRAEPRIAAKNDAYQPGGGDKKIQQVKLQWNAKSKIGSLENATHKPGGGEKKIENVKLDFKDKAKPKVGSKDNIKHTPGGGNIKTPSQDGSAEANSGDIEDHKLDVKAQSKIGSLDNVKHRPGGGDKKIFDDKDYLRQMSGTTSKAGSEGIPSGTQSPMHMSQSQVSVTDSC
uniref:Microtubule-associated protein n=1 Tax=Homalodisca liturata TaxID=320908 RepID=A0A1B6JRW9_9HEMI